MFLLKSSAFNFKPMNFPKKKYSRIHSKYSRVIHCQYIYPLSIHKNLLNNFFYLQTWLQFSKNYLQSKHTPKYVNYLTEIFIFYRWKIPSKFNPSEPLKASFRAKAKTKKNCYENSRGVPLRDMHTHKKRDIDVIKTLKGEEWRRKKFIVTYRQMSSQQFWLIDFF